MGLRLTSLIFEAINFVVLVWVLSRFLYRPLKKSLEERRTAHEKLLRDAEAKSAEAARELTELRRKQKELAELRERVMQEAAEDAAETRAKLLAEAKEDAAALRAQGERLLESERQAAEAELRNAVIEQSTRVAARLLAELAPRALHDALIDKLAETVKSHASRVHREHAPTTVDLAFALAPREEEIERLRNAFTEAFGTAPNIESREDAALVAGVVATVGDHVLDASVAGNLTVLADRARELTEGSPMNA